MGELGLGFIDASRLGVRLGEIGEDDRREGGARSGGGVRIRDQVTVTFSFGRFQNSTPLFQ